METKIVKAFWILFLLAVSVPAVAQYVATPPPSESPPPASRAGVGNLQVDPKNGQSQEQQSRDRYECHRWAKTQSGYDPTQQPAGAPPSENSAGADGYRRAMTACLEARGYAVRYGAASRSASPAPPPPAVPARVKASSAGSELKYRPITGQIHGGYTAAVGATDRFLDDGANIGFGLTWYPSSALPLGLRVDGSYTRLRARGAFLDWYGGGFTSGHDNIYGGDADLQLDLAHQSPWVKMYLFGGAGWYREQAYLRQVSWLPGVYCDWYFCAPAYVPVVTAVQRTTSPWHSSWNAGLGLEVSAGEGATFFVEARYQRISAYNSKLQFVPIRFGLRF
jgi:hypothetical protein